MTSICVDQLIRWHTSFRGKSSSSKKIRINIHMLCWWTRRPELTSFVCLLRFDSKQGGRTWPNGNVNKSANNGTFFSTWNSRKDLFWYMWWSNSGVTDATYATTRDDSKDQTTQWRHLAFFCLHKVLNFSSAYFSIRKGQLLCNRKPTLNVLGRLILTYNQCDAHNLLPLACWSRY